MKLDTNNDGAIDRAEAAASPRLAEHFDKADKDKDGRLEGDELRHRHRSHHRGHRGHGMMKLDVDNDGSINKHEASTDQHVDASSAHKYLNHAGNVTTPPPPDP